MIQKLNHACKKLNDTLGVSVPLPNPGKKALKTAAACHFIVGAGLAAAGAAFSSRWCTVLGGLGILNSILLRRESERG